MLCNSWSPTRIWSLRKSDRCVAAGGGRAGGRATIKIFKLCMMHACLSFGFIPTRVVRCHSTETNSMVTTGRLGRCHRDGVPLGRHSTETKIHRDDFQVCGRLGVSYKDIRKNDLQCHSTDSETNSTGIKTLRRHPLGRHST